MLGKLWKYFYTLTDVTNRNSSKSFALLVSTITGGLIALCVCFALVYDVTSNSYIKTNLSDLGIFLLCVGMYIAGSGIPKAIAGRFDDKMVKLGERKNEEEEDLSDVEDDVQEPQSHKRRR